VRVPAGHAADAVSRAYAGESDVAYAEPNAEATAVELPNDPSFGLQWGLTNVDAADAWAVSKSSASTIVAVVDTGVSQSHSDLGSKIAANVNFSDSGTVDDINGHGTHVAGIAAAATNNFVGIAGLGWNARIDNVKALGDNGSGSTPGWFRGSPGRPITARR